MIGKCPDFCTVKFWQALEEKCNENHLMIKQYKADPINFKMFFKKNTSEIPQNYSNVRVS